MSSSPSCEMSSSLVRSTWKNCGKRYAGVQLHSASTLPVSSGRACNLGARELFSGPPSCIYKAGES